MAIRKFKEYYYPHIKLLMCGLTPTTYFDVNENVPKHYITAFIRHIFLVNFGNVLSIIRIFNYFYQFVLLEVSPAI